MLTRTTAFRKTAVLLVLSLVLMGAGLRAPTCGGACCTAEKAPGHHAVAKQIATSHACCCGAAPVPCDLERDPVPPEQPESALHASPRVDAPTLLAEGPTSATFGRWPDGVARLLLVHPSAQGPPGPVFLLTQSLLC